VITEFGHRPDLSMDAGGIAHGRFSYVTFQFSGIPKGVAIDLLGIKDDAGKAGPFGSTWERSSCTVAFMASIPANVKTMDFSFVVQKTRAVEFLVKPPKRE